MTSLHRIAMWSGPRNISTAMMRAWGNRPDTFVCDEPFYAYYLRTTGVAHPGADEVICSQENDWRKVVAWLTEESRPGKTIFYQKHMTHHLLPAIDRGWLDKVTSAFLIREPRAVLASFVRIAGTPQLVDTGFPQQLEIFNLVRERSGVVPAVVDTRDVLANPGRMLRLLCAALGVEYTDAMLSWPPGPRATDGVWARHWYDAVLKTTTFQPYQSKNDPVPPYLAGVLEQADAIYQQLYKQRLGQ
jgi:Sulfotransferase domain